MENDHNLYKRTRRKREKIFVWWFQVMTSAQSQWLWRHFNERTQISSISIYWFVCAIMRCHFVPHPKSVVAFVKIRLSSTVICHNSIQWHEKWQHPTNKSAVIVDWFWLETFPDSLFSCRSILLWSHINFILCRAHKRKCTLFG